MSLLSGIFLLLSYAKASEGAQLQTAVDFTSLRPRSDCSPRRYSSDSLARGAPYRGFTAQLSAAAPSFLEARRKSGPSDGGLHTEDTEERMQRESVTGSGAITGNGSSIDSSGSASSSTSSISTDSRGLWGGPRDYPVIVDLRSQRTVDAAAEAPVAHGVPEPARDGARDDASTTMPLSECPWESESANSSAGSAGALFGTGTLTPRG